MMLFKPETQKPLKQPFSSICNSQLKLSIPLIVILLSSLFINNGTQTYTLDDPYIHLALARQIFEGNYGLQAGEYAAPSSSILWPFLLSPFSQISWFEQVPLVANIIFCLLTLKYIQRILEVTLKIKIKNWCLILIGLMTNIYGLVFTGMEHNLQILLVCAAIYYLLIQPKSAWLALLIAIMPLVRYENFAISLPLGAYLIIQGHQRLLVTSALMASISLTIGFSIFLQSLGLELLPSSIIAKTGNSTLTNIFDNIIQNIQAHYLLPILIGIGIVLHAKQNRGLAVLLGTSALAFYCFGKSGWYGRYETFFVIYAVLLCSPLFVLTRSPPLRLFRFLSIFFLTCQTLFICTLTTPLASKNINDQQANMAKLAQWLKEPVAVNDLGLVALRSGQRVLDLWGLGSIKALHARHSAKNSNWICHLMEQENTRIAMVYSHWFPEKPSCWIPVATLQMNSRRITAAGSFVTLYTTQSDMVPILKKRLSAFSLANPRVNGMLAY